MPRPADERLERLLILLVCPACRGALERSEAALSCPACALRYPVRDGIPRMVPEEAERLR